MTDKAVNYGVMGISLDLHSAMVQEETMGARIAHQMRVKNLSQSELSRVWGVSRMTVNQWVHDASEPTPENLLKLAEVLFDGDVHYLVHGPNREPPGGFPSANPTATGRFRLPFKNRG